MNASRSLVLAFAAGFLLAAPVSSCGPTSTVCDAESCANGCCDTAGRCQTINSVFQCGQKGAACQVCSATQQCLLGVCSGGSGAGPGGGGNGTTGGGNGTTGGGFGTTGGGFGTTGGGFGTTGGGSGNGGNITLTWTFDGRTCAQQQSWGQLIGAPQVTTVTVDIPGQTLQNNGTYPCSTAGTDGIVLTNFSGGTYSLTVRGWSAQNEELYTASGFVDVNGNVTQPVALQAEKGGLAIGWQFWNGSGYLSCAQAGVGNVYVNFQDSGGNWVYGNGSGYQIPCNTTWGDGVVIPWLAPGQYLIVVQGYDTVNTLYRTDPNDPPSAYVTAGDFPTVDGSTQIVLLMPQ